MVPRHPGGIAYSEPLLDVATPKNALMRGACPGYMFAIEPLSDLREVRMHTHKSARQGFLA